MEMQHHHLLHHHHPKSPHPTDFDSIFTGVSLQSLLLGDPILLTPPPPPFPPPSPDPLPHPHHLGFPPPPTFSFRASQPTPSADKRRPHARRNQTVPPPPPQRRRAQKVSDKLKALRMIVPCDPKVDISTMLEQTYKYVRYLEAQVLALLTMQLCTMDERGICSGIGLGGTSEIERRMIELVGRLSRKEVVEAVVNSGTAQKVMYEEGLCLLSEEQVRVLAWSAFQKQQQQQQQQLLSGLISGAANVDNNNNSSTSSCCYSYSSYSYT